MTRSHVTAILSFVVIALLGFYVASNTYWEDIPYPTPPKGEAITNPFYAAQRFAEKLGATTLRQRTLDVPSTDAVLVLSVWHWDLTPRRQAQIRPWVEAGGRLVVDRALAGDLDDFETWSDVAWDYDGEAAEAALSEAESAQIAFESERCDPMEEIAEQPGPPYSLCDSGFSFLSTEAHVAWGLKDAIGHRAVRVEIGRGSVTIIDAVPFTQYSLFRGDHAALFVAATQLKRGDHVVFLTEDEHPSLLALLWSYGAPAVLLFLAVVALFLWRGAIRIGPVIGAPEPRRRSMAEQIRGSGHFAMKFGEGAPLHAAAVRALTEAADRRIPAYSRLSRPQKIAALGKATGISGDAVVAAIDGASKRRPTELPNTLALLESARRQLLNPGR
jgi:hypothetical protein